MERLYGPAGCGDNNLAKPRLKTGRQVMRRVIPPLQYARRPQPVL